jgi:hypothetical protein
VYFPHQTFVSDVSEIPISFPFLELPFSILFPIKNMKTVIVLVFTDRFRPFSSLGESHLATEIVHHESSSGGDPVRLNEPRCGSAGTLHRVSD